MVTLRIISHACLQPPWLVLAMDIKLQSLKCHVLVIQLLYGRKENISGGSMSMVVKLSIFKIERSG